MDKVLIERMSWTEFEQAMKETDVVIIPVGSLEEHGPHNPLGVDIHAAAYCAELIGQKARVPVAPVMPFGDARGLLGFPGTVSIDTELLRQVLVAYAESFIRHGAKRFLFINGHGGNVPALAMAAGDLYDKHGCVSLFTEWWVTLPEINPDWPCDDHGGYFETSFMMGVNASLVEMSRAQKPPETASLTAGMVGGKFRGVRIPLPIPLDKRQKMGNMGRPPAGASEEVGKAMIDAYVDYNVGLVEELKKIQVAT